LINNDGIMIQSLGNTTSRTLNIAHISATLMRTSGSINSNKNKFAISQALAITGGETQTPCMGIACNHLFQARLINWQFTFFKTVNLFFYDIDTRHLIAHISKASTCYQANVAGTNHTYI